MIYTPDDKILEQSNEESKTSLENDSTEPAAPIDPPIEEVVESTIDHEE